MSQPENRPERASPPAARTRTGPCVLEFASVTIAAIEGPDLLIVFAIILLLFGGTKLPQLARSLGEAKREFENADSEPRLQDDAAD